MIENQRVRIGCKKGRLKKLLYKIFALLGIVISIFREENDPL